MWIPSSAAYAVSELHREDQQHRRERSRIFGQLWLDRHHFTFAGEIKPDLKYPRLQCALQTRDHATPLSRDYQPPV